MPFDSFDAPPHWRRGSGDDDDADGPWTKRDRLVAAAIVLVLTAITLGECRALLFGWIGLSHGA